MILVDTDVLVDCLRGTDAAKEWIGRAPSEDLAIPGIAAMELLIGCRNQVDVQQIQKFLGAFSVVWPDAADSAAAYDLLLAHRLSSGLGIPDCFVAAMAINRKVDLFTFNVKHFRVVEGLHVQQPYARA
jgi:predicted nucleic acid-binding protein